MFNFTASLKKATMLCVVALGGALVANAANEFVYNGIIWTPSGTKVTAKAYTTKVGGAQVLTEPYSGDIVIESPFTYNDVQYTVTSVGNAFKASNITSIVLPDDCVTISRGGFQDCASLKKVTLSSKMTGTMAANCFQNCVALEEINIPGGITAVKSNQFTGCTALKKLVLDEGTATLEINLTAFGGEVSASLEDLTINRPVSAEAVATAPFKGVKSLKSVTIGGTCVSLSASYFAGCSALETVAFPEAFTTLNTAVFQGTALKSVAIPGSVASIPTNCFSACKSLTEVVLAEGLTTIEGQAFEGSAVANINFPLSLTSIGIQAFNGCNISGELAIPAAVKTVGVRAFQGNAGITSVSLPASVTTLGDGAFNACTGIASYAIDAANATYKVKDNKAVATIDGAKIVAYPVADAATEFVDAEATAIGAYAFNYAKNLTSVKVDNCVNFGDYALANTGVVSANLRGTVGRYVLENCASLTEVVQEDGSEVPFAVCKGCAALQKYEIKSDILTLKQEAFAGCSALKEVNLGGYLAIIEADAFANSGVETIVNACGTPAAMTEGVFTEANSGITLKVPADYVDAYKAAAGWQYLNVVGDAELTATGTEVTMPGGLYYAGKDGIIYGVSNEGETTSYDVGGVLHTFQLLEFKNRIYGASAGKNFVYENTPIGDGKLFYLSQIDGKTFQAMVLDNTGASDAYTDPFALYIYNDTLYVSDRNVAVRKVSADAIALPQSYPYWIQNTTMGYYGSPWAWGCVKSGFQITTDTDGKPLYWLGMRYNGNGIYRFKDEHVPVGTDKGTLPDQTLYPNMFVGLGMNFSTFYIDEKNDHFYIYVVSTTKNTPSGLYRVKFSDLLANPDPSEFTALNPVLVDGAPIKLEGSVGSQETGITQLSVDENGEYMYWCYIAPADAEASVVGTPAEAFNAENPLHKSGIKRVKLGEETPAVEMVVEGVEGYGIVPVDYVFKTDGIEAVANDAAARVQVIGNAVTILDAALVNVYNAGGALVASEVVNDVKSVSLANKAAGLYIIEAIFADGSREVVKVVK